VNPRVMDYVNEQWEPVGDEQSGSERGTITIKVPDLSHCDWDQLVEIKKVFRGDPNFKKFKELITHGDSFSQGAPRDIMTRIKSVEDVLPWKRSKGEIQMTLASLPPEYHGTDGIRGVGPVNHLSGKIIILMEEGFS